MKVKYKIGIAEIAESETGEISSYMSQSSQDLKYEWVTSLNAPGRDRRGKNKTHKNLKPSFYLIREIVTRETHA